MHKLNLIGLSIAVIAIALGSLPIAFAAQIGPHQVWLDVNEDGIMQPGEPGMANIQVDLYRVPTIGDPYIVDTQYSGANGYFTFGTGLPAGTYYEQYHAPAGYVFTIKDAGTNDWVDSDVDSTGKTDPLTITDCQIWCSWKAGLYPCANGFTPGFWKHNIEVRLSHDPYNLDLTNAAYNAFSGGPRDGDKLTDALMDQLLASVNTMPGFAGLTFEDLLANLKLKGNDPLRTATANAFNAAAGYGPYSD